MPSAASRALSHEIAILARDPSEPVLIEGERGSGKTLVAAALHELSPRSTRPFVKLDLSCVSFEFANTELFGHVEGAFTGARRSRKGAFRFANGGTLFLDEIGKSSLEVQQRLLNVIEYGELKPLGSDHTQSVNVRVICATNVPISRLIEQGKFLPDLFGRIKSFVLHVSPLRERRSDLVVLMDDALARAAHEIDGSQPPVLDAEVLLLLKHYDWPDNVREVYSTVRRLVLAARGATRITLDHCPRNMGFAEPLLTGAKRRRSDSEKANALSRAGQNVRNAAAFLGVAPSTVYRFLERPAGPLGGTAMD